jgi:hypothetical protein
MMLLLLSMISLYSWLIQANVLIWKCANLEML